MSEVMAAEGFLRSLTDSGVGFTLAPTGSTARREMRNNSGSCDYTSDTDILCIINAEDIDKTLTQKRKSFQKLSLILMSTDALSYPSNAVLSIDFDALIENQLKLSKPNFASSSTAGFISYQAQPLAYYSAQLNHSAPEAQRRLLSKISISCLKLLYLADHVDRRSFVYERELLAYNNTRISNRLICKILNRETPDAELTSIAEILQHHVSECQVLTQFTRNLTSTSLYFLDKQKYSQEIIEAVFLENNRMSRADALF
ncbi:hypothetical protein ACU680_21895 [Pseudomonas koreensis]